MERWPAQAHQPRCRATRSPRSRGGILYSLIENARLAGGLWSLRPPGSAYCPGCRDVNFCRSVKGRRKLRTLLRDSTGKICDRAHCLSASVRCIGYCAAQRPASITLSISMATALISSPAPAGLDSRGSSRRIGCAPTALWPQQDLAQDQEPADARGDPLRGARCAGVTRSGSNDRWPCSCGGSRRGRQQLVVPGMRAAGAGMVSSSPDLGSNALHSGDSLMPGRCFRRNAFRIAFSAGRSSLPF
jgi:hypothetical protein